MNLSMYSSKGPLVRKSRLTSVDKGGIGKELSDGYVINYAIGCPYGCPFCYVDEIQRRFHLKRHGLEDVPWGQYFLLRDRIPALVKSTKWDKYAGKEILMCSMHDPFAVHCNHITRQILEAALPHGVRFCIQTRSPTVLNDIALLYEYRDQVRVQFSIATSFERLRRKLEPKVGPTDGRIAALRELDNYAIPVGLIIAPIVPNLPGLREDARLDLRALLSRLHTVGLSFIYGEALHARGKNLDAVNVALGSLIDGALLRRFDEHMAQVWVEEFERAGRTGTYWREHRGPDVLHA